MNSKLIRNILILILVISNIGCDQASKKIARDKVEYNEYIEVLDKYFIITKVENTGAFLGLGNDLPKIYWNILMLGLPILVLFGLLIHVMVKNHYDKYSILGLTFIIGGGMGNMIDRYLYQSVTDFMHIDFGFAKTGIFNMADVSVMVGVFILLFQYILPYLQKKKEVEEIPSS